jgi:bla regulator protein BlaR1
MANWSQSHFLQSLGWATLNSFWQMALLWCLYLVINSLFRLPSHRKYQLSVMAVASGFVWFVITFVYFFKSSSVTSIAFFNQPVNESNSLLTICLLSASVAYLSLLIFPSYKLFKNWQFVQRIKKQGLEKADLNHRLFVQKISAQLGIGKKVIVYLSQLVKSPVTVGYLKPIILLPVASMNHLSTQQVEAILLHELSHIRRYDYLVNFMISIISTFLYFNPFMKQFMKTIEEERENCCDQLVLQFGYDKVGYASALLMLEKMSAMQHVLALGATGKNYLLSRIENIVGMEKKKGLKRNQLAGILAALFCIVVFNSILIIKEKKQNSKSSLFAYTDMVNPLNLLDNYQADGAHSTIPANQTTKNVWIASTQSKQENNCPLKTRTAVEAPVLEPTTMPDGFIRVAADEVDMSLTNEQKEKVKSTIAATKKVYSDLQWQEVNTMIADVLTEKQKLQAKKEYQTALDQSVNWKNMEQNMKAQYEKLDWDKINNNVAKAKTALQLDSLERKYTMVLTQLNKVTEEVQANAEISVCPMPDQSIQELQRSKEVLSSRVNTIKALRSTKKVVRL